METKRYKLSKISLNVTDGEHGTIKDDNNGKYYLLSCKNIKNGLINITSNERIINEESFNKVQKRIRLEKNDVLITTVGTIGEMAIIETNDINYCFQRSVGIIKPNIEIVNPYYLYYSLKNETKQISTLIKGAVQKCLFINDMKMIEIDLPNMKIQNKIVKILNNIDKKIKLNNKLNNNLHELCNNMYFELVSQLDDSNSSSKQIKEVSKCVLGGTPSRAKSEYWKGNINWINSGEVNNFRIIDASEKITELGLQKSSTALLPKGTTVLAITGATLGQVSRLEIDSCANQSVIGIIPNNIELNNYIYLSILNTINDLILKQTGGAQQHINKNDVETHEIIIPNDKLLKKFDERTRSMFDKISMTCFENKRLEQLRDTLLPKLMNGEIDLDNIEI